MAKTEDGEFELVLGNRQLLSFFFIVMILMGVCFAMGYMVGRNSAPASAELPPKHAETKPVISEAPVPSKETTPAPAAEPSAKLAPSTPAPTSVAQPSTPTKLPSVSVGSQPESGKTYLQLVAVREDEAGVMLDVLRKNKFSAIAAEIPEKPGTFRVLVGPLAESDIAKTKTDLINSGFPGDKAIRRTF